MVTTDHGCPNFVLGNCHSDDGGHRPGCVYMFTLLLFDGTNVFSGPRLHIRGVDVRITTTVTFVGVGGLVVPSLF